MGVIKDAAAEPFILEQVKRVGDLSCDHSFTAARVGRQVDWYVCTRCDRLVRPIYPAVVVEADVVEQRQAEIRVEENRRHRAEHYVRLFNRGLITVVELAESTTEIAVCERCAEPWDEFDMSLRHADHGWLA